MWDFHSQHFMIVLSLSSILNLMDHDGNPVENICDKSFNFFLVHCPQLPKTFLTGDNSMTDSDIL